MTVTEDRRAAETFDARGPFRRAPIPAATWIGLIGGLLLAQAVSAMPAAVLAWRGTDGSSIGQLLTSQTVGLGSQLFFLAALFGMSFLRPRWIAVLAGAVLAGALWIAWYVVDAAIPAAVKYYLPVQLFIFGLVIGGAALVAHRRNLVDRTLIGRAAVLLFVVKAAVGQAMFGLLPHQGSLLLWAFESWLVVQSALIWGFAMGLLGLYVPAVLHRRERLRHMGLGGRRVPVFVQSVDDAALASEVRKLDDHGLLWASIWPDHNAAARRAIAAELERRGWRPEAIDSWSPDARELAVPPAVEDAAAPAQYWALCRAKRRYFRTYQVVGTTTFLGLSFAWLIAEVAPLGDPKLFVLAGAGVGALVSLVVGLRFRRRALRILLLRPFGEARMTGALKALVCAHLGQAGYVFTLSDRHYKPNLWVRLFAELGGFFALLAMYVASPILRTSRRIATIKGERSFRGLQKKLLHELRPAIYSFLAGEQAFNIRSTDAWWQLSIRLLMHSCDAIVVDLSKVKTGTEWELRELHRRSLLEKCIFVAVESSCNALAQAIEANFDRQRPPRVFLYGENGQLIAPDAAFFAERLQLLMQARLGRPQHAAVAVDGRV